MREEEKEEGRGKRNRKRQGEEIKESKSLRRGEDEKVRGGIGREESVRREVGSYH